MDPYRHKYIGTGSDKLMPLNLFSADGMIRCGEKCGVVRCGEKRVWEGHPPGSAKGP